MAILELNKEQLNNYLEKLVLTRFEYLHNLESFISEDIGLSIKLQRKEADLDTLSDFCLIGNININGADLAFIDIYYLIDNKLNYLITEVNVEYT